MAAGATRRAGKLFWTGVNEQSYGGAYVPGAGPSVSGPHSCAWLPLVNGVFMDRPSDGGVGVLKCSGRTSGIL